MNHDQLKEKVAVALEVINPDNTKATEEEKISSRLFIRELYMIVCGTSASNPDNPKGDFLLALVRTSKHFTPDEKVKAWLFIKETLALIYK